MAVVLTTADKLQTTSAVSLSVFKDLGWFLIARISLSQQPEAERRNG
jgi:hypothetical protein